MKLLDNIGEKLKEWLIDEWEQQGHKMNQSKFESEIEHKVEGNKVTIYGVHYAEYIDRGVTPQNIPYSPGTKSGKKESDYIKGLADYVLKRMGIGGAQGLSIAFAIAKTHKKEGMPTDGSSRSGSIGSYKYTKTGERTGFIDAMLMKRDKDLNKMIDEELTDHIKVTMKGW
jgi:hypothetical protein